VECFATFIGIVIVFALLVGFGGRGKARSNRLYSAYQRLALHYRGTCRRSGWFTYPNTHFFYRSAHVSVRASNYGSHRVRQGPMTLVVIQWPDFAFRCEVVYPRLPPGISLQHGLRDCTVASPEFEHRYTIRATDAVLAASLLNETVRRQIEGLRGIPVDGPLRIEFGNGNLQISKGRVIRQFADLLDFVQRSLDLYDQLLLAGSRGIEFLEEQSFRPLGEVRCQVCGEEIRDDLVFCRRCKTPHHRECWQYNGMCSVFACGETRFGVPQVAPRVRDPQRKEE
jgi:hypothetical protein